MGRRGPKHLALDTELCCLLPKAQVPRSKEKTNPLMTPKSQHLCELDRHRTVCTYEAHIVHRWKHRAVCIILLLSLLFIPTANGMNFKYRTSCNPTLTRQPHSRAHWEPATGSYTSATPSTTRSSSWPNRTTTQKAKTPQSTYIHAKKR